MIGRGGYETLGLISNSPTGSGGRKVSGKSTCAPESFGLGIQVILNTNMASPEKTPAVRFSNSGARSDSTNLTN